MKKFLVFAFAFVVSLFAEKADILVFSFDRPLQLYAFLESTMRYAFDVDEIFVVYRASSNQYDSGYGALKEAFPNVHYLKQKNGNTLGDFRPLVMKVLTEMSKSPYIAMAVDDLVVKDFIPFERCITALEETGAEGFHLRMGLHLGYCYPNACKQPLPPYEVYDDDICVWKYGEGKSDWRYPHTVDMCLYRKKKVLKDFKQMQFSNPNQLEGAWARFPDFTRCGLFFKHSKVVNLPLNLVNTTDKNRFIGEYSAKDLLHLFNKRKKMNIGPLFRIENGAAHMEHSPTFIKR